jgi:hypothetical protein
VARFLEAGLSADQVIAITRHVARHEFGHLVGLDSSSIRNEDRRGGIYAGHCANECTMHQVVSVPEAAAMTAKLQHKPHAGFCPDCTNFLRQR